MSEYDDQFGGNPRAPSREALEAEARSWHEYDQRIDAEREEEIARLRRRVAVLESRLRRVLLQSVENEILWDVQRFVCGKVVDTPRGRVWSRRGGGK